MSQEFIILLENANVSVDDSTFSYSARKKGAGYRRTSDGLHTAVYSFNNFTGTVKLQATLSTDPKSIEWFDIDFTEYTGNESTISHSVNFTGNFVWLRAAYNVQGGEITEIRFTY